LVNAQQPKVIFLAMLVEISVVNAHSSFVILFSYKDRISYPLWMDYFFNESDREEFSYLPFDCLMLIVGERSQALLFRHSLWVYIQAMLDQLLGQPWHICWFPRENVSVSPKKADEREFLFLT
jgi:hypothetical protein